MPVEARAKAMNCGAVAASAVLNLIVVENALKSYKSAYFTSILDDGRGQVQFAG
jgi:hypothetical protein